MNFGEKIRKIRTERGLSQLGLAKKLGYASSNSYISDVENGIFIPSKGKLKKLAKALQLSYPQIKDMLLESKIEELGIKEPELQSLFKNIPKLPKKEKKRIIEVYLSIKAKLKKKK